MVSFAAKGSVMEFKVLHHLPEEYEPQLVELYQQAWWSEGRTAGDIRKMLSKTDGVVVVLDDPGDNLVGFARFISDSIYKAIVFDVIVEKTSRGFGMGRTLMEALMDHPDLQSVHHVELYCMPVHVPFYEKWGFTSELGDLRFMRFSKEKVPAGVSLATSKG